jgi:hypothetical protein
LILVVHIVISRRPVRKFWRRLRHREPDPNDVPSTGLPPPREATFSAEIQDRVRKHGGGTIFIFKLARLLALIVFLSLSIYTTVLDEESRFGGETIGKKKKKKHGEKPIFSQKEWQDLAICLTSVRCSTYPTARCHS